MMKKLIAKISVLVALIVLVSATTAIAVEIRQPYVFRNTVHFNHNVYFDQKTMQFKSGSTLDVNGTLDLTDATITATGKITATHVADITREKDVPLSAFYVYDGTSLSSLTTTASATTPYIRLDANGKPCIAIPGGATSKYLVARISVPDDIDTSASTLGDWGFRITTAKTDDIATSLGYTMYSEGNLIAGDKDSDNTEYTLQQGSGEYVSSPREQIATSPRENITSGFDYLALKIRRTDSIGYGLLEVKHVVAFFERTQ